jgi:uncharacterized membrane protein YhaH (DUF805 family)
MDERQRGLGFWLARPWRLMFNFSGRSPRREYWLFVVQYYTVVIGMGFVVGFGSEWLNPKRDAAFAGVMLIFVLLFLLLFVPLLAAAVRRLHDSDKSGWLVCVIFIPGIGGIIYMLLMVLPGDEHENSYGLNPLDPDWSPAEVERIFG